MKALTLAAAAAAMLLLAGSAAAALDEWVCEPAVVGCERCALDNSAACIECKEADNFNLESNLWGKVHARRRRWRAAAAGPC